MPRFAWNELNPDNPELVWRSSPNFGYTLGRHGRGSEAIAAIVDHIAQGTKAGLDATFSNPNSQVSAHFGVMRDGTIHQYVEEEDPAWGAGILNQPDETLPWLPPSGPARGQRVNQRVISIEHEGYSGEPFTPEQFQATVSLHRVLITKWALPLDRDHVVGHYRLDSINRRGCPGSAFPWDELFQQLATGASSIVDNTKETMDKERIQRALDVVWGWSERLEQLTAAGAAKELKDAVVAIKEETKLQYVGRLNIYLAGELTIYELQQGSEYPLPGAL